jgi:beta-aspartyl-peptidase (threonine type)
MPFPSPIYSDVVVAVHGGAGRDISRRDHPPEHEQACLEGLTRALQAGREVILKGGTSREATVTSVCMLEDNPLFNAGRGASLAWDGRAYLDASLMDGGSDTQAAQAGAVSGICTVRNPIALAQAVMERSPYVLLAGDGAEEFARYIAHDAGLEMVENAYFVTPGRQAQLAMIHARGENAAPVNTAALPATVLASPPEEMTGTVGAVALDNRKRLCAATSTGGMAGKRWGRVGDSPLIGAGTWADTRCAISATGHGEYFIRAAVAHDIAARVRYQQLPAHEAADQVLQELLALNGDGGGIVLDSAGRCALPYNTPAMYRGCITRSGNIFTAIF